MRVMRRITTAAAVGLSLLAGGAAAPPVPLSESAQKMSAPPGYTVTLFAGEPDLVQPVAFSIDDRGRVWAVEGLAYPKWEPKDRIIILEDVDNDGKFDKKTLFIDKLTYVTGIETGFGGVFVTAPQGNVNSPSDPLVLDPGTPFLSGTALASFSNLLLGSSDATGAMQSETDRFIRLMLRNDAGVLPVENLVLLGNTPLDAVVAPLTFPSLLIRLPDCLAEQRNGDRCAR